MLNMKSAMPERALRNLASTPDPIARLKAVHELGVLAEKSVAFWVDQVELEHVRAARNAGRSWEQIGAACGWSHTHARRRFADRV